MILNHSPLWPLIEAGMQVYVDEAYALDPKAGAAIMTMLSTLSHRDNHTVCGNLTDSDWSGRTTPSHVTFTHCFTWSQCQPVPFERAHGFWLRNASGDYDLRQVPDLVVRQPELNLDGLGAD